MSRTLNFAILTGGQDDAFAFRNALAEERRVKIVAASDNPEQLYSEVVRWKPQALIVNLGDEVEPDWTLCRQISAVCPETVIICASHNSSPDLILDSLRAGAREFLRLPIIADEMRTVVNRVAEMGGIETRGNKKRGSQATVLGHAVRQGRYPLELSNTKLSDLLAMAGGVAPDGSDTLTVVGTREGKAFRKQVDLRTLFRGGNPADDIVIVHNDVIYIERMPQIYVYGEVQRPGVLRLERGMTVLQALAASGGLTLRGTQRGIRVHRRGADGTVQEMTPGLQETLQQDDVVFVRESLF